MTAGGRGPGSVTQLICDAYERASRFYSPTWRQSDWLTAWPLPGRQAHLACLSADGAHVSDGYQHQVPGQSEPAAPRHAARSETLFGSPTTLRLPADRLQEWRVLVCVERRVLQDTPSCPQGVFLPGRRRVMGPGVRSEETLGQSTKQWFATGREAG